MDTHVMMGWLGRFGSEGGGSTSCHVVCLHDGLTCRLGLQHIATLHGHNLDSGLTKMLLRNDTATLTICVVATCHKSSVQHILIEEGVQKEFAS